MKMKRIANNVALQTIGYVISGFTNVYIYVRECGYQNGANQSGTKQSDAVKTHIAMTKNHAAIIKQLCDLVPPEKKKESRLQALRDE